MYYSGKNGTKLNMPANKVEVSDVTRCGDTAIAAFVFYRCLGKSVEKSIKLANITAEINVQHIGCYHVKRYEIEESEVLRKQ